MLIRDHYFFCPFWCVKVLLLAQWWSLIKRWTLSSGHSLSRWFWVKWSPGALSWMKAWHKSSCSAPLSCPTSPPSLATPCAHTTSMKVNKPGLFVPRTLCYHMIEPDRMVWTMTHRYALECKSLYTLWIKWREYVEIMAREINAFLYVISAFTLS